MTSFLPLLISNSYKATLIHPFIKKNKNNIGLPHASIDQSELSVPDNSVITTVYL